MTPMMVPEYRGLFFLDALKSKSLMLLIVLSAHSEGTAILSGLVSASQTG